MTRCLLLLCALAATAAAGPKLAGTWEVTMERPANWTPRICTAELKLVRTGGRWEGTIQWQVLMNGRRLRLRDIVVRGSKFSFTWDVERFEVDMEGRLKKRGLKGKCVWKGVGSWPFTAERATQREPKGVVRIEQGADFKNYFDSAKPEEVRVDPEALDRLLVAAQKSDTDALLVLKDKRVVCERYFHGWSGRMHIMSVTKFVTSLAIAQLLAEKKVALHEPVSRWFPEWKQDEHGKVTLRHLMAHTSGLVHERLAHTLNKKKDKVAYVLGLPVKDPGAQVRYSNEGAALLSGIISKAAGKPADAYLKDALFEPLSIRDWAWDRDAAGHTITYAQLYMRARDLARIGQHALDKRHELKEFARPGKDRGRGLIWRLYTDPKGFGHTGWLGQFLVVYPEKGLVGVRLRRARDPATFENRAYEFGAFAALLGNLVR